MHVSVCPCVSANLVYVLVCLFVCLFVLCLRDIWLLKNHFIWSWSANGNSWHSGKVVFQLVYSIMISILKLFGRVISLTHHSTLRIYPWIQWVCIVGNHIFVITQVHTLHKTYSINTTTNEMNNIGLCWGKGKGKVLKFGHTIRNDVCAFRHIYKTYARTPIHSKRKHFHYESSSSPTVSPLSTKLNWIIHRRFCYAYLLDVMNILKM